MTPTPKLRFVERDSHEHNGEHFIQPHRVRILQQWWEANLPFEVSEWRDIPLEQEA
jgi:hypothetical protein